MKRILVLKDYIIDLDKVSAINMDEGILTFYFDSDWEIVIEIDPNDIESVKKEIVRLMSAHLISLPTR